MQCFAYFFKKGSVINCSATRFSGNSPNSLMSSPSDPPKQPWWFIDFLCSTVATILYYVEFFSGTSRAYYRLTPRTNGPDCGLSLVSRTGRLQVIPAEDSDIQYWQIVPTIFPRRYRIHARFGGRAYSLEVRPKGPEDTAGIPGPIPILTPTRFLRGQFWRLHKDSPNSTTFRLSNALTGTGMFLDIYK